jgi:2-methylcitrate dehydratase PrpD
MSDMNDAGTTLSNYFTGLTLNDIPTAVTDRVKHCLLDFFAVTIGAAAESPDFDRSVAAMTALNGASGNATIIGRNATTSSEMAAFANALLAHTYDFDDTNVVGFFHPGAAVHPPALATAEALQVNGHDLLTALVAGYELSTRVGAALGETAYDRGFHITPVAGIFGGTTAVSLLHGFDAQQMNQALGMSGSQASGSMQYLASGAWNKRFHPAFASRAALNSVALIASGALGATGVFDGPHGLLAGYSANPNVARLTDGLGDEWLTLHTGVKPYPSCRFTHGAVDAAVALYDRVPADVIADERTAIEVRISERAYAIVGTDEAHKRAPKTVVDGQFSVYFQVAAGLHVGRVTTADYAALDAAPLAALMGRMQVVADSSIPAIGAEITLTSKDGETFTHRIDVPGGEPPENVNEALVVNKFATLAGGVLPESMIDMIVAAVLTLETQPSIAPVLAATTSVGAPAHV